MATTNGVRMDGMLQDGFRKISKSQTLPSALTFNNIDMKAFQTHGMEWDGGDNQRNYLFLKVFCFVQTIDICL